MNTLILNWTSIVNVEKTSKIDFAEVQKTSFEYVFAQWIGERLQLTLS